jgi:putative hydrolase of the HAD superfamily
VRVIMMDVDGVLVRGRPSDGRHFATDLERDLGIATETLQREFFKPHWSAIVTGQRPLKPDLAAVLAVIAPQVAADTLIQYWFENDSRIDRDVLGALSILRTGDTRVFLATNQEHMRASYLMNELGLAAYVDGIVYSAALGHRKPAPEFYEKATAFVDALPSEIVLVDDTLENVTAARAFGWQAKCIGPMAQKPRNWRCSPVPDSYWACLAASLTHSQIFV